MNPIDRITISLAKLQEATNRRMLAFWQRKWIEHDRGINILNYWYYRFFTNRFEIFLITVINTMEEER